MGEGGYKIRDKEGVHFVTFAVVEWVDVFTRKDYRDVLLDSLRHCQQEKGLVLHSWCLMSNHVHLVVSAKEHNTSDILRDFKKYTGKQIIKAIAEHPAESSALVRVLTNHLDDVLLCKPSALVRLSKHCTATITVFWSRSG
ncbi:MAG: transposase [Flavobacterium sp.]|nr:transposase [Flavobacterium sp.]